MNEENVLKHPKKPALNNNNRSLSVKFKATKIPKKKEAIKFTIEVFCISKPIFILQLFCINILSVKPKALPSKMIPIEKRSKFTSLSSLL